MLNKRTLLLVPAAFLAVACGRGDNKALDSGLQTDLSLAAQAQQPQQVVSPQEAGYANTPYGTNGYSATPQRYQTVERAPVYVHRSTRRSSGSYSRGSSSGSYGTYPAPAREPVRHTKRDAGIGAAAGAVIGATTSRDKVKGAIIGAAAGGILGGIIGHTVDVSH